jgi:hypothetical protein
MTHGTTPTPVTRASAEPDPVAVAREADRVRCAYCDGSGTAPIPRAHASALAVVRKLPGIKSHNVARALGIQHTAACNRLAWLRDAGFIRCTGAGTKHSPLTWEPTP